MIQMWTKVSNLIVWYKYGISGISELVDYDYDYYFTIMMGFLMLPVYNLDWWHITITLFTWHVQSITVFKQKSL